MGGFGSRVWYQSDKSSATGNRRHSERVTSVCFRGLFQWTIVLSSLVACMAAPARADSQGWVDEIKFGVLAHDIRFLGNHVERGADINLEILFTSPAFLRIIGAPRLHLGGVSNTDGNTDYGYIGLTWSGRP